MKALAQADEVHRPATHRGPAPVGLRLREDGLNRPDAGDRGRDGDLVRKSGGPAMVISPELGFELAQQGPTVKGSLQGMCLLILVSASAPSSQYWAPGETRVRRSGSLDEFPRARLRSRHPTGLNWLEDAA